MEWEEYNKIEPIGHDWRSDYRTAHMCAVIVNTAKSLVGSKDNKTFGISDFLIDWDLTKDRSTKTEKQSPDQMKFILRGMVKSRGGQVQRRDPEKHEQLKQELGIE